MISLLQSFGWRDVLDIIIVAFIIYRAIILIKGTGAFHVLVGLIIIFAVFLIAVGLKLYTTPTHEHHCTVTDIGGDLRVRQRVAAKVVERGVHAVAQVLRGVDQRAVQVKDQQLQGFDGKRTKYADHASSVKGGDGLFFEFETAMR